MSLPNLQRRRLLLGVAAALCLLAALGLLAGQGWVGSALERKLDATLAKGGFTLQRETSSWTTWGGLEMTAVKLGRAGEPQVVQVHVGDDVQPHRGPAAGHLAHGGVQHRPGVVAPQTPVHQQPPAAAPSPSPV